MDDISVKALGKINLGLDVLRRREDGYHEVRMIMQTVHLHDRLRIKKTEEGIHIETNLKFLPTDSGNLAYRAAALLQEEFHLREGVHISLHKKIPVAAGMAGGSTDAAGVLYGMNQLYELGLSKRELMERGSRLGADVPYCLMRGTALAEGIGEKLTALPPMVKCPVIIAKPPVNVSTKYVYENLALNERTIHPDIDQLMKGIAAKDLQMIALNMGNVLESVTIHKYPEIAQIKEVLLAAGAVNAMMSGSGPSVFALFDQIQTARAAMEKILESGLAKQVFLTDIYNNRR